LGTLFLWRFGTQSHFNVTMKKITLRRAALRTPNKLQMYHKCTTVLIIVLCAHLTAWAQFREGQRFAAGVIAGVTASQIDGDISAGYHKLGLTGGINVLAKLKERQAASIEILFTQRGCRYQPQLPPYFATTLNYVEVPVSWHYFDWLQAGESGEPDWYRVQASAGLVYGRLLGYQDKFDDGFGITAALPNLEENSVALSLAGSVFMTRHVGITIRWQRAVTRLYKVNTGGNYDRNLWEHYLAFQMNYRF
jgi:hypothetical protein